MAEERLCKNDISAVFKRLRNIQSNKICFDCGAKNPTWASVTYGVFICMDCSAVHRSLGVHLSFVRSTQLDTSWTWLQLRAMQVGGNSNATSFFQQHGCTSSDAQQKYNSRAAQLYKEKLHQQASAAMRLHGTKVHIELPHVECTQSPEKKEVDFFQDIAESHLDYKEPNPSYTKEEFQNSSVKKFPSSNGASNHYPELEVALSPSATKQPEARKSTLSSRKPVASKKTFGVGGMRGLGAQKVVANFSEIEKEAEKLDQQKEQESAELAQQAKVSVEDQEKQMASVRLAYKDLSLQQKQTEEKLRQTNPKKAEQLERLGMGFGVRSVGVTHSAASDMKLITQDVPQKSHRSHDQDPDDDFEFLSFTSGPPKFGDSPFLSRSSSDRISDLSTKGSWSSDKMEKKNSLETLIISAKETSGRSRKSTSIPSLSHCDDAQKKFGNAKGISSEQFFGPSKDTEYERKANLSRFEGSSSISSADYFGDGKRSPSAQSYNTPNLYDIKEGVKDGVTKVAGRISSIANGVMSSLQRK